MRWRGRAKAGNALPGSGGGRGVKRPGPGEDGEALFQSVRTGRTLSRVASTYRAKSPTSRSPTNELKLAARTTLPRRVLHSGRKTLGLWLPHQRCGGADGPVAASSSHGHGGTHICRGYGLGGRDCRRTPSPSRGNLPVRTCSVWGTACASCALRRSSQHTHPLIRSSQILTRVVALKEASDEYETKHSDIPRNPENVGYAWTETRKSHQN